MSLKVWLPLNGNVNNQGTSSCTITSASPQYSTAGKIGEALSLSSSINSTVKCTYPLINNTMSICFWINPNTPGIWSDIFSFGGNNRMEVSSDDRKSYTWYVDSGKKSLISSGTYLFTLNLNTWSHVVIAIDETNVYFYVNSVLTKTVTRSSATLADIFAENAFFYIGARVDNSCKYTGLINDFRIYDHCLSVKEIKEISKALICHYPLDGNGRGGDNIVPNTFIEERSYTYPSSGNSDKWAATTSIIPSASQYVLSFYAKSTVNGDKARAHWYSPNTTTRCESSQGTVTTNSDGNIDITLSTEWKKYWVIYTQSETTAVKHLIFPRLVSGNGTGTVSVKQIKLEEGTIPTPWCPNSADAAYTTLGYNSTTEVDTSGYGNNGTRSGNISSVSDTPRLNSATYFPAGSGIYSHPNISLSAYTFSFWGKHTDVGKMLMGNSDTATSTKRDWYWYGDNSFKYPSGEFYYNHNAGTAQALLNKWTHFVAVYDGSNITIYRNSINEGSKAATGSMLLDYLSVGIGFGSSSYWENGYISDFRLYATALSADDVKELYQSAASITNNGAVMCYEFDEE